jgi:hypothetical protein
VVSAGRFTFLDFFESVLAVVVVDVLSSAAARSYPACCFRGSFWFGKVVRLCVLRNRRSLHICGPHSIQFGMELHSLTWRSDRYLELTIQYDGL